MHRTSSPWAPLLLAAAGCGGELATEVAAVDDEVAGPSGSTAWASRVTGDANQHVVHVARAPGNGVYITGETWQSIYYRGELVAPRTLLQPTPFVARIDPFGHLLWIRHDPIGTGEGSAVGSNAAGDVVVAGSILNGVDLGCGGFEPQGSAFHYTSFDADGNCLASRGFTVGYWPPYINAATPLPDGGAVVAGGFSGRIDADGIIISAPGHENQEQNVVPFVIVFDADGTVRWARAFQPADGAHTRTGMVNDVGADATGRITLAGELNHPLDVDGETLAPVGANPRSAAWLAVFEPDGQLVRADAYGESGRAEGIDVAPDGTTVVGGTFLGTMTFPGGLSVSTPGAHRDVFVVKLEPDGTARWTRKFWGSAVALEVADVSIDVNGHVGVAGTMGPGNLHISGRTFSFDIAFMRRIFVARLGDLSGSTMWAQAYGAEGSDGNAWAYGLAVTDNRRLVVGGSFTETVDFGSRLRTADEVDGFVMRIYP